MMRVVALLLCGVLVVHGNSDGAPAMACSVTAPEFLAATTMCSNRPNRNANLSLALPAAFVPGAADALPIALSGSIATIKGVLLTASAGALATHLAIRLIIRTRLTRVRAQARLSICQRRCSPATALLPPSHTAPPPPSRSPRSRKSAGGRRAPPRPRPR